MPELIDLLKDGLVVLTIGMGVVFFFLVVLIFSMDIMSKIILILNKKFPEPIYSPSGNKTKKRLIPSSNDADIAAILAVLASRK